MPLFIHQMVPKALCFRVVCPSVFMRVCAYMHAQVSHSLTGLPSTFKDCADVNLVVLIRFASCVSFHQSI